MKSAKYCFIVLFQFVYATGWASVKPVSASTQSLSFLRNEGQWQSEIHYRAVSSSLQIRFLEEGISFAQANPKPDWKGNARINDFIVWNMKFINPSADLKVKASSGRPTVLSYLYGADSNKYVIHPFEFSELAYYSVFNNVDLHFYDFGGSLKYDYVLHPGANLHEVKAFYEGVSKLEVNRNGELEVTTSFGVQIQKKPVSWQLLNGKRQPVEVEYVLINDTTFGFAAPFGYNDSIDLIIDPLFQMVWSSYTNIPGGSNNMNYCFANAIDANGNVYLTGYSDDSYPITAGAYSNASGIGPEIYVAKFSSDGSTLIYWTYLLGESSEFGTDIDVDELGRAYITGEVSLNITGATSFATTPSAYQPVHNTGSDAFLTVLNSTGSGLVYSSFLGGTGSESGYGVSCAGNGIAYITGKTSIGNFPVVNAATYPTGSNDVFVAKFDINLSGLSSLVYSVRIGGGSFASCYGRSIAVNSNGNAFVTGSLYTSFGAMLYPTTPGAFSNSYNTGQDGVMSFVTKLSNTVPVSLEYSTFLGPGPGSAIDVHPTTDEAYIVGSTRTFTFPVTANSLQPIHGQDILGNGNGDAFLVKMNATGTGLIYSTFLGGRYEDSGTGLAVNNLGEAYVSGIAQDSFPVSPGAIQTSNAGSYDFYVVHVDATGSNYGCGGATYVGGSDADYSGSFYDWPSPKLSISDHGGQGDTILVSSTSHSQDFPTTPGVFGPVKVNGIADQPVFFTLSCSTLAVPPVSGIAFTIDQGCIETTVDFTDISLNNPTSWQWSFPGGFPAISVGQNPAGIAYSQPGTYTATLVSCNTAGCDTATVQLQVSMNQIVNFSLGNDTVICSGSLVSMNGPSGMSSYNWSYNGTQFSNQQGIQITSGGIYILSVTTPDSCFGADSVSVSVNDPTVDLGTDVNICEDDTVTLSASGILLSGFQWTYNGNLLSAMQSTLPVTDPGIYSVQVFDTAGCAATDTVIVNQTLIQVSLPEDTVLCDGNSLMLTANGNFTSWQWYQSGIPAGVLPTFEVTQSGMVVVEVTDSGGCSATDDIFVQITQNPQSAFNYSLSPSCLGTQLVTLNQSASATGYEWYVNDILVSEEFQPIILLPASATIQLQLVAINGQCLDTSFASVHTDPSASTFIPKVFSPNGDSSNECFIPDNSAYFSDCFVMKIFNRWGAEVFKSESIDTCWDGHDTSGHELPASVYYYIIYLGPVPYTGTIELIR
jgi:gliding motility-associated-like protein